MKRKVTSKTSYEIYEKLGHGLTSEVYRAFRVDFGGWTRQEVALKILNSNKDVQIFKQEFEKLIEIHSEHCVKIMAWDNIGGQQALVLELIRGKTFQEVLNLGPLDEELIIEVLTQIFLGLQDLHKQGVFHGDLNLKNIMIDKSGLIKLIDFGDEDPKYGCQLVTSDFASPSRRQGNKATAEDDLYALNQMAQRLLGYDFDFQNKRESSFSLRNQLAFYVNQKIPRRTTRFVKKHSPSKAKHFGKWILHCMVFLLCLLINGIHGSAVEMVELSIKSQYWFQYSINGMPAKYGPVQNLSLREGNYHIVITDRLGKRKINRRMGAENTFLLQPLSKNIR